MAVSGYPNTPCSCAASFGCLLHGRSNRVSNEPFRRCRTLACCRIHSSFWPDLALTGCVQKVAQAVTAVVIAVDITITISLCTLLAMNRSGFHPGTDRMILRLIFISVNTGLSSTLFALLFLILVRFNTLLTFLIYPTDLICTALYYPLCTVYCNTLLANLNVRSFVRGGSEIWQLNTLSSFVAADVALERTGWWWLIKVDPPGSL
jgi:hypothetical protein